MMVINGSSILYLLINKPSVEAPMKPQKHIKPVLATLLLLVSINCNASWFNSVKNPLEECALSRSSIYLIKEDAAVREAVDSVINFEDAAKKLNNKDVLNDYNCLKNILFKDQEHEKLANFYSINNLQILAGNQEQYDLYRDFSKLKYPFEIQSFIASEAITLEGNKVIKEIISFSRKGSEASDALFEMFPEDKYASEKIKRLISAIVSLEAGRFKESTLKALDEKDKKLALARINTTLHIIPYLDMYVSIFLKEGYLNEIAPQFYQDLNGKFLLNLSK